MAIKNPYKLFGEPVEGALEKFLAGAQRDAGNNASAPISQPITPLIPAVNISDPSSYIILPGRKHGLYEYPDFLAAMHRLSHNSDVERAAKQLGFEVANSGTEQGGIKYIGNINREQAIKLNANLGNSTLTLRQFIDFKELLESGLVNKAMVYNGAGRQLSTADIQPIYNEIFEVRKPWRSEWLDAIFTEQNGDLFINYEHCLANNNLTPNKSEKLEEYVTKNSWIDVSSFNKQGLPTKKSKAQKLYYYFPVNDTVAGFCADSGWAVLGCYRNPLGSYPSLGVRAARKKI